MSVSPTLQVTGSDMRHLVAWALTVSHIKFQIVISCALSSYSAPLIKGNMQAIGGNVIIT